MRTLVFTLLIGCLSLSPLFAAPTSQEQANYDAACLSVVDAVNTYRMADGKAALVPLVELCRAAREDAEFREIGVGVSSDIFTRSTNLGYAGTYLSGSSTAFISRGQVAAATLLQNLLATAGNPASFLNDEADYIGVGMALKIEGASTEYHLRIVLGREVIGGPADGTPGQESGTGRGLLDPSLFREIRAGAWAGDSINGFMRDPGVIVLTVAEEKTFIEALGTFARKSSVVRIAVGKGVTLRLPSEVVGLVEKFIIKGELPPGIRFDTRTNRFRGSAKKSGRFSITLSGNLKGPVKGSEKLKPIRIQFAIGG